MNEQRSSLPSVLGLVFLPLLISVIVWLANFDLWAGYMTEPLPPEWPTLTFVAGAGVIASLCVLGLAIWAEILKGQESHGARVATAMSTGLLVLLLLIAAGIDKF